MKKLLSLVLVLFLSLGAASAMADSIGLGIQTSIGSSKDASVVDGDAYDGTAQVDSTVCTVVLDDEGVIKAIKFDVAQTKVGFSPEGVITADKAAEIKSKIELGEDYGMRGASPISAELFEQFAAFEAYCIGQKAEDIIDLPTYAANDNHPRVADVADLKSSVTIDIGAMQDSLAKAVANAQAF